ncbi:NAD-dependent epimerase/dehydratase family protein [Paenibacillus sp. FSL R5-0527]|uniref:NAD-dependent epimerase/dehydratase family protein n=1 Tax=Paenibacillus TaxID=44249 RepID=UPI00097AA133|nr:NAD-dependent epimerase/dehydratase family protein [Paenibacillus macerans]MEC0332291.1 epimerase [Paenibacillus macerans]OMG46792.1 epimerase [Paenibacillus macerans]
MKTVNELEQCLSEPSDRLVRDLAKLDGDFLILGVGGKMGPSLAKLLRRGLAAAGKTAKITGVSRFSSGGLRGELEAAGIATLAADLLDEQALAGLPEAQNVIYMAGNKFGTTGREYFTWAMNAYLPGRVAEKYKTSRIVAFSSGNIYPLTDIKLGGASEDTAPSPVGEYAQSCLGRERVFEYFSRKNGTPLLNFRLNYAIDMRYGVLLEVAKAVKEGRPIDLNMGMVNVIWQGDANEMAIRSLLLCVSPPVTLNVTGPETVSVRWLAERFGDAFGVKPVFTGEEQPTALLSNASAAHAQLGYPRVSLRQMIEWTAGWVEAGGETLSKPTHFQERAGAF